MEKTRAGIVIPCYNEFNRLDTAAFLSFSQENRGIHFLFVNDGSVDKTADLLLEMQQHGNGRIDVLALSRNQGKAEAVRQGMLQLASGDSPPDYVGFWDADLATPLDAIPVFQGKLDLSPLLCAVFGARVKLLGRSIERHLIRHYFGRLFATAASAILRIPIYDTQCGAKMFRVSDEFRQVLARPFLTRWVFDVEIIARYAEARHAHPELPRVDEIIYEYPLRQWHDIKGSKLRFHDFIRAGLDLITIFLRYHF